MGEIWEHEKVSNFERPPLFIEAGRLEKIAKWLEHELRCVLSLKNWKGWVLT